MKYFFRIFVFLLVLSLVFQNACFADNFQNENLNKSYEQLGITNGATWEELIESLDVIIESRMRGATLLNDELYILSYKGIHRVTTSAEHMLYPFENSNLETSTSLQRIFAKNDELWGFCYDWELALEKAMENEAQSPEELGFIFGRIDLSFNGFEFVPMVEMDVEMLPPERNMGIRQGVPIYPYFVYGKLYCKNYVLNPMGNYDGVLRAYDLDTGIGQEICNLSGVYEFVPCGDNCFIGVAPSYMAYLGTFPGGTENLKQIPLVRIDTRNGNKDVIAFLGECENDSLTDPYHGELCGLAYDEGTDSLYYARYGELHRFQVDNKEDIVIAPLPSNWLQIELTINNGFLTSNGYYMSIAVNQGVEIIKVN